MMFWAVAVGIASAVFGCWLATRLNTSSAGMMAVMAGGQVLLAVLFAPRHGLVSKLYHNLNLTLRILGEDIIGILYRAEEGSAVGKKLAEHTFASAREAAGGGLPAWLAVPRLWWNGEIRVGRGLRLRLTARGRQHGQLIVRGHRLWEAYLGRHVDLPLDHLHAPAERLEHFLGPALQEQLAGELAQPGLDPHGREIPPKAD
jgi:manganese/zinc/iron transport system permease protein